MCHNNYFSIMKFASLVVLLAVVSVVCSKGSKGSRSAGAAWTGPGNAGASGNDDDSWKQNIGTSICMWDSPENVWGCDRDTGCSYGCYHQKCWRGCTGDAGNPACGTRKTWCYIPKIWWEKASALWNHGNNWNKPKYCRDDADCFGSVFRRGCLGGNEQCSDSPADEDNGQ